MTVLSGKYWKASSLCKITSFLPFIGNKEKSCPSCDESFNCLLIKANGYCFQLPLLPYLMYSSFAHCLVCYGLQDYEPSGTTPVRTEPEVPTKGIIESLRAMPMDALLEEFRENNSYESFEVKELKPSLIPRSPLTQLNWSCDRIKRRSREKTMRVCNS